MAGTDALDQALVGIVSDWVKLSAECAEGAVVKILENSGQYLSEEHQKALQDFHSLYFAHSGQMNQDKEAMNREVDDLFDAIQAEVAQGRDGSLVNLQEDEEAKKARLSLSGVQKQLETIIQLETGIKDKLVPILTSMQFEDVIRQRLTRLAQLWQFAIDAAPADDRSVTAVSEQMSSILGSAVERKAFYPLLLNKEAPKEAVEDVSWFDSL